MSDEGTQSPVEEMLFGKAVSAADYQTAPPPKGEKPHPKVVKKEAEPKLDVAQLFGLEPLRKDNPDISAAKKAQVKAIENLQHAKRSVMAGFEGLKYATRQIIAKRPNADGTWNQRVEALLPTLFKWFICGMAVVNGDAKLKSLTRQDSQDPAK